jgi:MYXO-CTERM domain-containing protein
VYAACEHARTLVFGGTATELARLTHDGSFQSVRFEENHVRKVAVTLIALSVLATSPFVASAQQADDDANRTNATADRDDHGEWGWLGLLGLVGLVGLKRRDRDHLEARDRATAR